MFMLYFTLSDFYNSFELNNFLIQFNNQNPDAFKMPIKIKGVSGNFPYCIAAGNKLTNTTHNFATYYDIFHTQEAYSRIGSTIQLDCSNYFLTTEKLDNHYLSFILDILKGSNVVLEISNIELIKNFQEKYPNFNFVISASNGFTEENLNLINQLCELEYIERIVLNPILNQNLDFLKLIKRKSKIGLVVNSMCPYSCPNRFECYIKESEKQKDFSERSIFFNCDKIFHLNTNPQLISLDNISQYTNLGFKYFYLDNFATNNKNEKLDFYLNYFIKPEYHERARIFYDKLYAPRTL